MRTFLRTHFTVTFELLTPSNQGRQSVIAVVIGNEEVSYDDKKNCRRLTFIKLVVLNSYPFQFNKKIR